MPPMIDWNLVPRAISVYELLGYRYFEVPWVVTDEAMSVTMPPGRTAHRCLDGPLVGSAEQSFIQLAIEGTLQPGRYVAATPCFRDDEPDALHQRTFFKVEMIEFSHGPIDNPDERVLNMANEALFFFTSMPEGRKAQIVQTPQGLDIELHGIELGSYGYRNYRDFYWIYGTGLAEPRFSLVARSRTHHP